MNLGWVIIGFLSFTTTAIAEDKSPWFGSEASTAQQITVENQAQLTTQSTQQATLESSADCTLDGCPRVTAPAK